MKVNVIATTVQQQQYNNKRAIPLLLLSASYSRSERRSSVGLDMVLLMSHMKNIKHKPYSLTLRPPSSPNLPGPYY